MKLAGMLTILSSIIFLFPFLAASRSMTITPMKENGEVVLFDTDVHDLDTINNYTASWRKGSDIIPAAREVTKGGEKYVEFSFSGNRGMACSTIYFSDIPNPDEGMTYTGIVLVIDYDGDDYAKISVNSSFSDKTNMTRALTLDRGTEEYPAKSGFRRADFPPKWELLSYIMINVHDVSHYHGSGVGNDLVYRLKRITLVQDKKKDPPKSSDEYRFGQPVLNPQPKEVLWKEGKFLARKHFSLFIEKNASARTRKTVEIFKKKYYGYTGNKLTIKEFHNTLPDEGIVLRIEGLAMFNGRTEKLREEGYCLVVDKERITITGYDEPGLYYGGVTLFQIMKSPMKIEIGMPIPCAEILDWPDLENRLCRLEHVHHFRNREVKENRGIDYLIDWTDRFVAGNKLNVFFLDISPLVKYERRPEFNGRERIYSLEDVREFGQFCRDNFIEVCPAWQIGGHGTWWLLVGYHPEMREKGWQTQADITHPEHDQLVFDCMLDVIEALQPKYLSPKSDEWWHSKHSGETPDELLRGKSRAQAFLDFHVKLNNWLKEKGITMMIYHDMLSPYHNGKRYDTYKIIDEFPKDVIISLWTGRDHEKQISYFVDRGFDVWINATGMFLPSRESVPMLKGYGKGMYSWGQCKTGLLDKYNSLWPQYVLFRAADYAWNIEGDNGENTQAQVESGRLVALRNIFAVNPNPYAGEEIEPIDLSLQMTHSFNEFLKDVKAEEYVGHNKAVELDDGIFDIGFIPTRITDGDAKNCIVLSKNAQDVSIPIDRGYSSLIFLHTAYINDPSDPGAKGVNFRKWPYGWPCGNYVVQYSDDEQIVIPLRLPMNIKRFDTSHFNRATNENRYVHTLKDSNSNDVHLFQLEWVNPKPKRKIKKVVFQHDGELDVMPILMAISGRSVRGLR